jgi:tetratricopeptide (TPR) repeat protein
MAEDLTKYEFDVFLSHNHKDEEWTAQLAERLEKEEWQGRTLRVFFSPWDIQAGQSIPLEIERGLQKSRKVGLIMSPDAMASAWVELERLVTTYIAVSARQERLIPLLRRDCEIPPLVQHLLYINFKDDAPFEENYQKLLAIIKGERPPRVARTRPSNPVALPASIPRRPIVGFVARRDENGRDIVGQLKEELAPERNQLVVLWGAGGVGKTTLAVEVAQALSGVFEKRMVWASPELRADFTFTTLLDEIAAQLGRADLRPLALEPKEEQVRALLGEAPALVILDNFETIKPDEQTRCAKWLAQSAPCPALITTRQRVDAGRNIAINAMSLDEAREFVSRWIEREARNKHAFEGLERDRIIEAAGRNPLVLQWVVARIDLANEPADVLEDLLHGEGDAAQRVFDNSFRLPQLGDDGRDTLLALSLFIPDASREALTEAAGFNPTDRKRLNEAITRLSSLWLVETTQGNKRLKLEGLTRELAKHHLSKDTRATDFRRRFVAYFLRYAEAHPQPTREDYDALEAEKDNLVSAMDAAFEMEDGDSVLRIADVVAEPVSGMLSVRGYWDEAIQRGEQALAAARNLTTEAAVMKFAHNVAVTYQRRGELTEARRLYVESLEINKRLGNQSGIAVSLHQLGRLAGLQGNLAEAQRLYDESLEIAKRLGNQSGIAITLHALANLVNQQGDLTEARRLYNESLEITRKLGDKSNLALLFYNVGLLEEAENNEAAAARLFREALNIFEGLQSPYAEVARRCLERVEGGSD